MGRFCVLLTSTGYQMPPAGHCAGSAFLTDDLHQYPLPPHPVELTVEYDRRDVDEIPPFFHFKPKFFP